MIAPRELHQLQTSEARVPILADDDVIVHRDPEWGGDVDDLPRHLDVSRGGRRIARGVIVHQDDCGGRKLQRAFDQLARVDRRMIDRPLLLHLVGDQVVALVEKQDAKLLFDIDI
jgi:hypothetical protein